MHETVAELESPFGDRLLHPWCTKKHHCRSFLTADVRLFFHCSQQIQAFTSMLVIGATLLIQNSVSALVIWKCSSWWLQPLITSLNSKLKCHLVAFSNQLNATKNLTGTGSINFSCQINYQTFIEVQPVLCSMHMNTYCDDRFMIYWVVLLCKIVSPFDCQNKVESLWLSNQCVCVQYQCLDTFVREQMDFFRF